MKVVMTQSSTIYSAYLSDQLREDMKRDDLVNEGRLSRSEAEQQADEWAQVSRRWAMLASSALMVLLLFGHYICCAMIVGRNTIAEV